MSMTMALVADYPAGLPQAHHAGIAMLMVVYGPVAISDQHLPEPDMPVAKPATHIYFALSHSFS